MEVEAGIPMPRHSAWHRVRKNLGVRMGGIVLLLLAIASILAPWLGTVDPTLLDPTNRDLLPGASGEIMQLTGESLPHTFWMGTDSYGRDIYSRVLYGGRISLVVGITVAVLSMLANFAFVPYYPVWSLLIIALDFFVIWALIAYKRDSSLT